ncbi:hypothetical protein BJF78_32555 [Pseudonocardia sp. CNS-139]|nr:hypothetical protein BJF78_32555 [Pseudonocardia sp. CNS-139]
MSVPVPRPTPDEAPEATTHELLDSARVALEHSYALLAQVRQGRESAAREAASILERLRQRESARPVT